MLFYPINFSERLYVIHRVSFNTSIAMLLTALLVLPLTQAVFRVMSRPAIFFAAPVVCQLIFCVGSVLVISARLILIHLKLSKEPPDLEVVLSVMTRSRTIYRVLCWLCPVVYFVVLGTVPGASFDSLVVLFFTILFLVSSSSHCKTWMWWISAGMGGQ
jgi:hypothetical protein